MLSGKAQHIEKAIVFGCDNVGLGVIRSLASAGVQIIAFVIEDYEFAYVSRFVSKKIKIPSIRGEGSSLLNFLLKTGEDWDGALLVPTSDASLAFIAQHKEALACRYVPGVQDWNVIKKILNKGLLYRAAQKVGVPLPKVMFSDSSEFLMERKDDVSFPCILKPYETHRFFPVFGTKLLVVHNFGDLIEKFNEIYRRKLEAMVSEIIPGTDDCLYHYHSYRDKEGDILAEMCTQKIRQHPPHFGVSRVIKTIPLNREIKELALRVLRSFSFHGFSCAEFKYDRRDNQYKLMEINARPVISERLSFAAGVNFPYIAYMDLVKGIKIPVSDYRSELYWIDYFSDVLDFIKWRKYENLTFRDYLMPYLKKKVFCVPFFDDPLPFFVKSRLLINQIAKWLVTGADKKKR